jgi:putative MATE family efflux protein
MTHRPHPTDTQPLAAPELGEIEAMQPPITTRRGRAGRGLPTHLPLRQQVWVLAKWPMLEQFMAFMVLFVDTSLAGHLANTKEALQSTDAVGGAGFVVWLMGMMQGSVGVGATALVARAIGRRHKREATAAVGQAIFLAVCVGVLVSVIFYFLAPALAQWFGLKGQTLELASTYLRMMAVAAPFMSLLFVGGACLRGSGDFRTTFFVMVGVNIVNAVVSATAVLAPAPLGGHGLMGIGFGTVVAWVCGGTAMVVMLLRGRAGVRLFMHRLKPQGPMLRRLLRISIPSVGENGLYWLAHASVIHVIGHMDSVPNAIGIHTIAVRIEALSFLPGFAFGQAAATMVGQYLGANRPKTAKKAAWICLGYGGTIMTLLGVAFIVMPQVFVRMITDKPEFLETVPQILFITGWTQLGSAMQLILGGAIRGAGDTRVSMALSLISMYCIRVPGAYLVGQYWGMGLRAVWVVLAAEVATRGLLFLARFLHGGWMTVKV